MMESYLGKDPAPGWRSLLVEAAAEGCARIISRQGDRRPARKASQDRPTAAVPSQEVARQRLAQMMVRCVVGVLGVSRKTAMPCVAAPAAAWSLAAGTVVALDRVCGSDGRTGLRKAFEMELEEQLGLAPGTLPRLSSIDNGPPH
jgi:hypothetical protein